MADCCRGAGVLLWVSGGAERGQQVDKMIEEPSWNQDLQENTCSECEKPIVPGKELHCVCDKYGNACHEEFVWCSESCMAEAHPEP
jgi:hypothetical protein